jgi:hypothetical protein
MLSESQGSPFLSFQDLKLIKPQYKDRKEQREKDGHPD